MSCPAADAELRVGELAHIFLFILLLDRSHCLRHDKSEKESLGSSKFWSNNPHQEKRGWKFRPILAPKVCS